MLLFCAVRDLLLKESSSVEKLRWHCGEGEWDGFLFGKAYKEEGFVFTGLETASLAGWPGAGRMVFRKIMQ